MQVLDELRVEVLVHDDVEAERIEELLSNLDYQTLARIIQHDIADPRGGTSIDHCPIEVKVYVDKYSEVASTIGVTS